MEMTPDERGRFEREQVHHEDVQDSAGPASEADSEPTPEPVTTPDEAARSAPLLRSGASGEIQSRSSRGTE